MQTYIGPVELNISSSLWLALNQSVDVYVKKHLHMVAYLSFEWLEVFHQHVTYTAEMHIQPPASDGIPVQQCTIGQMLAIYHIPPRSLWKSKSPANG